MTTKHTPGPWLIKYHDDTDTFTVCTLRSIWEKTGVAHVSGRREDQQNAWLIAAAPDLLRHLERAADIIMGEYPESQWLEYGVPDMLATIKRAKGE